ncbi:hypothetical protein Pla52n_59190 [Stieleria varia]|uniref:Leucine Rich repeats (2 copies) n=1 Tax=Stieleria varia TaxID=2528005 RepID=A0A5C6A113_9BACT|nr:hypothetical protein Pla52n_59190 [Stieleria varia]
MQKGGNERRWESFADEGGYSGDNVGGISFDGNGDCIMANVRDRRGYEKLLTRRSVCQTLPSLMIYGPEAFTKFDPQTFPSLERVSLGGITIDEPTLQKLQQIANLRELSISDFSHDPVNSLHVLRTFDNLRSLAIRSDQISSLSDFPDLPQLRFLTVDCAELTEEAVEEFTNRFSKCVVSINVEPYRIKEIDNGEPADAREPPS